jgi:hypothetical protein
VRTLRKQSTNDEGFYTKLLGKLRQITFTLSSTCQLVLLIKTAIYYVLDKYSEKFHFSMTTGKFPRLTVNILTNKK